MSFLKKLIINSKLALSRNDAKFDVKEVDEFTLGPTELGDTADVHQFIFNDFITNQALVYRLCKRGAGAKSEFWLIYRDAERKLYVLKDQSFEPDIHTPGFVKVDKPLASISFSYTGKMVEAKVNEKNELILTNREVDFVIDGKFDADSGPFDYIHNTAKSVFANALSDINLFQVFSRKVTWRKYVDLNRDVVLQSGRFHAAVKINNRNSHVINAPGVRFHTIGVFDWEQFDRYISNTVLLENGDFIYIHQVRHPYINELKWGVYFSRAQNTYYNLSNCTGMDGYPYVGTIPETFLTKAKFEDREDKLLDFKTNLYYLFNPAKHQNVYLGFTTCVYDNAVKGFAVSEFGFHTDQRRWYRSKRLSTY